MHKLWKTRAELQALPEPARPRACESPCTGSARIATKVSATGTAMRREVIAIRII